MNDVLDTAVKEILDRMRRVETRLTKLIELQGFDTHGDKPKLIWEAGDAKLILPSPSCTLKSILDALPKRANPDVQLMMGEEILAVIRREI
jgi:hypothetical protein